MTSLPSNKVEYDAGPLRMTHEPARVVSCGCGRKGQALIMTSRFVEPPFESEVRRWVRPPPGWLVFAGDDPRRVGDGKIEGPFFRCDECAFPRNVPSLQDPTPVASAPPPNSADFQSPALTVDQLAALLNIHRKTIYEQLQKGLIPGALKVGSVWRIHGPTVLTWLSDQQRRVSSPRRYSKG